MSRAVYVYRPGHPKADRWNMVDVRELDAWQEKPEQLPVVIDRHYWGATVPGTGEDIGSRTKHRQYLKDRNLTTMDDYTQEWATAAKERENVRRGIMPDFRERREELGKIHYEVEKRERRGK